MTTILKTEKEKAIARESGRRLSRALDALEEAVRPGVSTLELDRIAEDAICQGGDVPAFLNYTPEGARRPFPNTLCASVNEEIVHGIPKEECVLKEGDIIGLDLGLVHEGIVTDSARTVAVGNIRDETKKLLEVTKKALFEGIGVIKPGAHIGDIGFAIQSYAKPFGYGLIRELGGHSVGHAVHEPPYIPNFGKKGTGELIEEGMVLAIEPMLNLGGRRIIQMDDGYTIKTADGSVSAHFEHTVLVTENGAEIVTEQKEQK